MWGWPIRGCIRVGEGRQSERRVEWEEVAGVGGSMEGMCEGKEGW